MMQATAKTLKLGDVESFSAMWISEPFSFPLKPEVGTADRGVDVASRLSQPQTLTLHLIFFAVTQSC